MALKIYLAAALLFTSFLSSGKDVIPRPSAVLPAWRTDVRTAVGTTPLGVVWGRGREYKGRPIASLWFTNKDTIVATFITREGTGQPKVSQRDAADNTLPLRLRAIFLDATTGKITAATDWPTQTRRSLIVATLGGRFVTQRGNELTLYDSDRKDLRTANLPPLDVGDWYSHTSPTGKNILFFSEELWKGSWIWVETDTLRVLGSGKDTSNGFVTISDEKMATATCFSSGRLSTRNGVAYVSPGSSSDCEPKIMARGISTEWKTIAPGESQLYPQFVNEDTLFLSGTNRRSLIRTDGKILLEERNEPRQGWGAGCWGTRALPSANGQRLVVPSCHTKGAVASLDIGGHSVLKQIHVYEIGSKIQWKVLDVRGPRIQDQMEFAVSPDGSKFAVLNDQFVQLFELPPQ